ncbi:MAG TPA: NADH-ubiquinone oxidoreductase-F iron-sulfur binding region domain-containing protein [Candidatus Wallbacteria bacterium]|nr:MAG: NAD-reducing hydrogenase HoxS subunit alpha [bacterium ADurb.Bin243]HOD41479.1 NADH-ubiquinone oxidoreductase-F iron-sulfur binding region domain-containing protein [Candidatus Wallbacteria bacterium]HPG56473.1 NADH-ubiquinone oxidoreductase-F iron-sulfur binding region domain-containing protein [Candidatus Wallbacteria bacterium]
MIDRSEKLNKMLAKVNMIFNDCDHLAVLKKAIADGSDQIIKKIFASGLRGRGGAGFNTALKWKMARENAAPQKYVICNADEGEPGTFKDREILEKVLEKVLLGMAICATAIGSSKGFLYLRGEYNFMLPKLQKKIDVFNEAVKNMLNFNVSVFSGSGAYICGEETALIESMEGRRGEPRNKPPFPVSEGYRGCPTVVNNVETLVYAGIIMEIGPQKFFDLGTHDSKGAKVFSISGDTPIPGIYELELGMKLDEFVEIFGDGDTKAVQVGGASGFCVPRKKFAETVIGFEGVPTGGSMMLFNSGRSMYNVLHNYLDFFCEESCGQCAPCRIGCVQMKRGIEAIKQRRVGGAYAEELKKLGSTMRIAAKCGLGQSVPNSFNSIVDNFIEEIIY